LEGGGSILVQNRRAAMGAGAVIAKNAASSGEAAS
jgi:hypothetical protein